MCWTSPQSNKIQSAECRLQTNCTCTDFSQELSLKLAIESFLPFTELTYHGADVNYQLYNEGYSLGFVLNIYTTSEIITETKDTHEQKKGVTVLFDHGSYK